MTTVMVVEPEILVRMVISEFLRHCGFRVIEAHSADDALAVLGSGTPLELVFSEVHGIGSTDGFTLARQVRERHPEVDVILTSGVTNAAGRAADLCNEGVLQKPYKHDEVVRRINVLRERRRSAAKPTS